MRLAAAFLLIITFVLDLLAGAGCVVLGLKGAEMLLGLPSMLDGIAGEYSTLIQGELQHAVTGVMALEGKLAPVLAALNALGIPYEISFGNALAAAGALVMLAGLLALIAGIRLARQRPGTIVYVGSGAALLADAAPLTLLGFSYLQLPGLIGGLLGMLAARIFNQPIARKPAAKPTAAAEPAAAAPARPPIKIRPSVRTADDPRPDSNAFPGTLRRVAVLVAASVILIGGAIVAFFGYQKHFGPSAEKAPPQTTAATPALPPSAKATLPPPPPKPAPPAMDTSGPVQGQLAGLPFKPRRVALNVTTRSVSGDTPSDVTGDTGETRNSERISLVLDAGKDLQLEITALPEDYDFAAGLNLRVNASPAKPGQPKLTLITPQSDSVFPKTEIIGDGYELDLKLDPLRGNRVSGRIALFMPSNMKTRFGGKFRAWVDGHPEIEPDLTRGGIQTFKYLAHQYLKEIHPGSKIVIKDDTYSHQVGDPSKLLTGHIMVVYTVDGADHASILRLETNEGHWRVLDWMEATYLAEAHPIEIPDPRNEGQWVNYLAARHTEEWFREDHPGKYPWTVRFTGTSNTEIGYADIHLHLKPYGEPEAIERRYYFLRTDGRWRYIRDLKEDEQIDQSTGKIVKIANTS